MNESVSVVQHRQIKPCEVFIQKIKPTQILKAR